MCPKKNAQNLNNLPKQKDNKETKQFLNSVFRFKKLRDISLAYSQVF